MVSTLETDFLQQKYKKKTFLISKNVFLKESFKNLLKLYLGNGIHAGIDFLQQKYKKKTFLTSKNIFLKESFKNLLKLYLGNSIHISYKKRY
jgi:hypothetical protein